MKGYRFDAAALAEEREDPYLAVGRMLRQRYGPIDWQGRIARDPKIRELLATLTTELQAVDRSCGRGRDGVVGRSASPPSAGLRVAVGRPPHDHPAGRRNSADVQPFPVDGFRTSNQSAPSTSRGPLTTW